MLFIAQDGNKSSTIYGVSKDYFSIMNKEVALGDEFTEEDVQSAAKVCIIGEEVREELFPGQDPTGKQIRIDKVPFTIIGVLKEIGGGGGMGGQDQDNVVIAPFTTVQNRLYGGTEYNMIVASALTENNIGDAAFEATTLLREAHKLLQDQENDFQITTQMELQEITGNITYNANGTTRNYR